MSLVLGAVDLFTWFDDFLVFVTLAVFVTGAIGLISRSMALSTLGAYVVFVVITIETGDELLTNILYVSLVMVFIGFAFKLWRLEGVGE